MSVWVDCDWIVADTMSYTLDWHSIPKEKKIKIAKSMSSKSPSIIVWNYFNDAIIADKWYNFLPTIEWSKEKLEELKKIWYNLYLVSARPKIYNWKSMENYTIDWIEKYFHWLFSDIILLWEKKKSTICKDKQITYFFEDFPSNIDDILTYFSNNWWWTVFQKEYPWFKLIDNKNVIPFTNWKDLFIDANSNIIKILNN